MIIEHAISEFRLIPAGSLSISSFNGREERKLHSFVNLEFTLK